MAREPSDRGQGDRPVERLYLSAGGLGAEAVALRPVLKIIDPRFARGGFRANAGHRDFSS